MNLEKQALLAKPERRVPATALRTWFTLAPTLAALLAACASGLGPLPTPPDLRLDAEFAHAERSGVQSGWPENAVPMDQNAAVLESWWEMLGSQELDAMVDRALASNPDLRIANLQVQEAAIRRDGSKAGALPELSLPVTRVAQYPGGQIPGVATQPGASGIQMTTQGNLQASWHADVWGEQQAIQASAEFQLTRAVHQREDTQRQMIAALVTTYIEYLATNDAIRSTREQIEVSSQLQATTQQALDAHDAVIEDVERSRAALAALQVMLPSLELQRDRSIAAIAFMVGAMPNDLHLSTEGLDSVGVPDAGLELNSRLLLKRPDIRMMESRMLAARADIAAARARLLPPIDFSAASGFSGSSLTHLLTSQFFFWNAVASVTPVIFDGGRRAAEDATTRASYEEMVSTYMRTILQAAREVEDALGAVRAQRERLDAQAISERSTARILGLNRDAYRSGAVSTATVLEAQRVWQQSHADRLRDRGEYLKSYVALYASLGAAVPRNAPRDLPAFPIAIDASDFGRELGTLPTKQTWAVQLAGIYAAESLPSVWRDLRARFPVRPIDIGIQAELAGTLKDGSGRWYRLRLVNFSGRAEAEAFCGLLRDHQQLCTPSAPAISS